MHLERRGHELVLSSYHVSLGDWTQVVSLVGKHLSSVSHFTVWESCSKRKRKEWKKEEKWWFRKMLLASTCMHISPPPYTQDEGERREKENRNVWIYLRIRWKALMGELYRGCGSNYSRSRIAVSHQLLQTYWLTSELGGDTQISCQGLDRNKRIESTCVCLAYGEGWIPVWH